MKNEKDFFLLTQEQETVQKKLIQSLWHPMEDKLSTYLTCQPNTINPSVTRFLSRDASIQHSCCCSEPRSTDALCKGSFSITNLMFSFPLPVFVLFGLFLQKMTQCINKYIHKYAKHLLWMMRYKKKKKNLVEGKENMS